MTTRSGTVTSINLTRFYPGRKQRYESTEREGTVLLQTDGQLESAEEKNSVQESEPVPAPEPENAADPTPENSAEDTVNEPTQESDPANNEAEPTPESDPANTEAEPKPEKKDPQKKAPQKKAPPKKASSKKAPPKKAPPKRPPPKSTKQLLIGLLIKVGGTAALVWAIFTFVLGLSVHYGNNMYPSVHDGDLLVSFRLQKPYINSVVLYRINGKTDVGRVIALEGSVVDIADNGMLTVNGVAPSEEVFYATYRDETSAISFPYTVEKDKVFILNDFREDKNDSRVFGAVKKKDLEGPMLFTVRRRNF